MSEIRTSDGRRLFYRWDGPADAPVVLLSNSLGCTHAMWQAQMAALVERFRVLRYDTRGHGQSEAPSGEYTLDRLGQDVVDLLDGLGIATVRFCGLSLGGATGQWLGVHAADRLDRLVIANSAAQFGAPELWQSRVDAVLREGTAPLVPAVLERWFTPEFRSAHPETVATIREMLLTTDPKGYAGCCAALRDVDLRSTLPAIAAPTLVIGGLHDPATPPEKSREIADAIPGAGLELIGSAHLGAVERPAEFNAALMPFLEESRG